MPETTILLHLSSTHYDSPPNDCFESSNERPVAARQPRGAFACETDSDDRGVIVVARSHRCRAPQPGFESVWHPPARCKQIARHLVRPPVAPELCASFGQHLAAGGAGRIDPGAQPHRVCAGYGHRVAGQRPRCLAGRTRGDRAHWRERRDFWLPRIFAAARGFRSHRRFRSCWRWPLARRMAASCWASCQPARAFRGRAICLGLSAAALQPGC